MPEQSKFENMDLFASLEAIMKQNTGFYQSDLDIDKEIGSGGKPPQGGQNTFVVLPPVRDALFPGARRFPQRHRAPQHMAFLHGADKRPRSCLCNRADGKGARENQGTVRRRHANLNIMKRVNFFSFEPKVNPGVSFSTMKAASFVSTTFFDDTGYSNDNRICFLLICDEAFRTIEYPLIQNSLLFAVPSTIPAVPLESNRKRLISHHLQVVQDISFLLFSNT